MMDFFEKKETNKIVTAKIKEIEREISNNTMQINKLRAENNVLMYQLAGLLKAFEELNGAKFDAV